MPNGGCFCGKVRYSYDGEPAAKALCHCQDCRKITGSTYSTNFIVPENGFKIDSGTPKTLSKTADTGSTITSFFCSDCGSTMWRESATFTGHKILKAGTLDDAEVLAKDTPNIELYAASRVGWVPSISSAAQKEKM